MSDTPRTNEEEELERAKLHGPDTRTIDALTVATACARAAERDFMQAHRNCIQAREKADRLERELAALEAKHKELRELAKAWLDGEGKGDYFALRAAIGEE